MKKTTSDYKNFRLMYDELKSAGYPDINNYKNGNEYDAALKLVPIGFEKFIEIVLKWLPKLEYKVGGIVLLAETKNKYDGQAIISVFEESDASDRWRICDKIVQNPPLNINEWVRKTYLDKRYGYSETGLLPLAIVKMFPKDEARAILKQGFDHHPEVTPEALGKVGTAEDLPFLEEKLKGKYEKKFIYKEIEKAIKKIKKRAKIL